MQIAKAVALSLLAAVPGGGCGESSDARWEDSTPTTHQDSTPTSDYISTNLGAKEAGRHVDAMLAYGGSMAERCDQMTGGSESGNKGWADGRLCGAGRAVCRNDRRGLR